jgi:pimeloyl-ACP methyl ester carboxylesterase
VQAVDAEGVRLVYDECGDGPPVLLVHGTAANLWGELPSLLAKRYRVISYDRRSFGQSKHPPLADLTQHARDAATLLRALDTAPAVIVGSSIGGVIGLDLALEHPDLVKGLVLLEPPLHAKHRPTLPLIRAIVSAQILARLKSPHAGAEAFLHWALGRANGEDDLSRAPEAWREAMLENGAAIVRELDAGTGEHLRSNRLRALRAPVRWLLAEWSDRVFAAAAERASKVIPELKVTRVERSGHFIQWDSPEDVVAAVEQVAVQVRDR